MLRVAHRKPAKSNQLALIKRHWEGNDRLPAGPETNADMFDAVLDGMSQGVCFFDRDLRLIASNRRYADIYGLSPEQIRPGMTLRAILALRAAGGGARDTAHADADEADGRVVHLGNGRVVCVRRHPLAGGGYVSTHEDITERWIAEAALRHGEKLRTLGQMTCGIAHDLGNLLTMIGCGLEDALAAPGGPGGDPAAFDRVLESIDAAIAQVRRMAEFARPQPSALDRTDLNAWLATLRQMAARMLGPRYRLHLLPDPDLPAGLVDRSQLEGAVLNLIVNARDAMPNGGTIILQTERIRVTDETAGGPEALAPGDYAAIAVSDSGAGMAPEVAARVFEPFFTTKPAGNGSGLGLSMVRQFAVRAGGSVALRTAPGVGTSVRILLPGF